MSWSISFWPIFWWRSRLPTRSKMNTTTIYFWPSQEAICLCTSTCFAEVVMQASKRSAATAARRRKIKARIRQSKSSSTKKPMKILTKRPTDQNSNLLMQKRLRRILKSAQENIQSKTSLLTNLTSQWFKSSKRMTSMAQIMISARALPCKATKATL